MILVTGAKGADEPSRWNTLRALRVLNWAGHGGMTVQPGLERACLAAAFSNLSELVPAWRNRRAGHIQ